MFFYELQMLDTNFHILNISRDLCFASWVETGKIDENIAAFVFLNKGKHQYFAEFVFDNLGQIYKNNFLKKQ